MTKVGTIYREGLAKHIKSSVTSRSSTFVINYSGVSGPQMNTLRKEMKKKGAKVFVSRKSISGIALKELKFDQLADSLNGQTAFIWADSDSSEVSKALVNFAKECKGVSIVGGVLQGAVLHKDDVQVLSDLPSREVLISQLLGVLQAPLSRLAGALNAKTQELLSILSQLSEKKGGS